MTKDKLKDGDRLTLRNGHIEHLGNNPVRFEWNDDLTVKGGYMDYPNAYDIVKVERIQVVIQEFEKYEKPLTNCGGHLTDDELEDMCNKYLIYQTIWERSVQPKYKIEPPTLKEYTKETNYLERDKLTIIAQPKKIEPLPLFDRTMYEGTKHIPTNDDIIKNKINEIIEVLNNGNK